MMTELENLTIDGRALVRCDFNVPLEDGKVKDDFKIRKSVPTLRYLADHGAQVIIISHLGRPLRESDSKDFTLHSMVEVLEELLDREVGFAGDCIGPTVEQAIEQGPQVMLLENVRFYPGERENDPEFAQQLAETGDFYINDAFAVSHRAHASVCGITEYLPSIPGLSLQKEIDVLTKVIQNPDRPLSIIIGGSKVKTKTKALSDLFERADHLMLGGMIANVILKAKGVSEGQPELEPELAESIDQLNLTSNKLHLPTDVVVASDRNGESYTKQVGPGSVKQEEKILDVGPETIEMYSDIINNSDTVVWNGPLGVFEKRAFEQGTKKIGQTLVDGDAYAIAGGGDTGAALAKFNLRDKFDHVSTGGGALLEFLTGKELPGIAALD